VEPTFFDSGSLADVREAVAMENPCRGRVELEKASCTDAIARSLLYESRERPASSGSGP